MASGQTKSSPPPKLIMFLDRRYSIFLDFTKGDKLREMGLHFHKDKNGIPNLAEDEFKAFLEKDFQKPNLESFPSGHHSSLTKFRYL